MFSQISNEESLINRLKGNPKLFHQYIHQKKTGAPSVGPLKSPDGTSVENCAAMAEMFADSFASVLKSGNPNPFPHQSFHCAIEDVKFTLSDVTTKLSVLNIASSTGPNSLHPRLLKSCPVLAYAIYKIYKASLHEGVLPTLWKSSEIVSIFKKGSRSVPFVD